MGNLETLIGSRALYSDHVILLARDYGVGEVVEDICASPAEYLKELTRVFKKSRKFRRLTREYI